MHRRDFCKAATVLGLTSYASPGWIQAANRLKTIRRVRPGDPAWPVPSHWDSLKTAVDGNLIAVTPLFGACNRDTNDASCQDVRRSVKNPFYIGDQPGGTQTRICSGRSKGVVEATGESSLG